jgi:hypothetical protein
VYSVPQSEGRSVAAEVIVSGMAVTPVGMDASCTATALDEQQAPHDLVVLPIHG